jgi:hypothetical protein
MMILKTNLEFSVTAGDQLYGSDIEPVDTEEGLVFIQNDMPFVVRREGEVYFTRQGISSEQEDNRPFPRTNSPFSLTVRVRFNSRDERRLIRLSSEIAPVYLGKVVMPAWTSTWNWIRQDDRFLIVRQDDQLETGNESWSVFEITAERVSEE